VKNIVHRRSGFNLHFWS